jgi:hypothetical protein
VCVGGAAQVVQAGIVRRREGVAQDQGAGLSVQGRRARLSSFAGHGCRPGLRPWSLGRQIHRTDKICP